MREEGAGAHDEETSAQGARAVAFTDRGREHW